jgi:hypothetical protein
MGKRDGSLLLDFLSGAEAKRWDDIFFLTQAGPWIATLATGYSAGLAQYKLSHPSGALRSFPLWTARRSLHEPVALPPQPDSPRSCLVQGVGKKAAALIKSCRQPRSLACLNLIRVSLRILFEIPA